MVGLMNELDIHRQAVASALGSFVKVFNLTAHNSLIGSKPLTHRLHISKTQLLLRSHPYDKL